MITIVDYGTGNLASISNMLKRIGHSCRITSDAGEIASATKLILPGVGAFDTGMQNLIDLNLVEVLNQKANIERVPILGICLGMQLFVNRSEEGRLPGLGWIDGSVVRFKTELCETRLKVPHMSWNFIDARKPSKLFSDMYADPRFYFVHSYHIELDKSEHVLAQTVYGYPFVSAVEKENVVGVQFHPEKSHKFGMRLLTNFAEKY